MSKKLVVYFSCTGTTRKVAENLVEAIDGDLYEIIPKNTYTDEDLNWRNKNSRVSLEMMNKDSRPEISTKINNMEEFDTIFLGFPIWWYTAPRIINTFLESYDFSRKTVVVFFTSGGSGLGNTISDLKQSCSNNVNFIAGKRFGRSTSVEDLKLWVNSLEIKE